MPTQEIDVLPLISAYEGSGTTQDRNNSRFRRKLLLVLSLIGLFLLEIVVMLRMASIATEPRYVITCCDVDEYMDESGICLKTNGTIKEFKVPKYVTENQIYGVYDTSKFILVPNMPACSGDYSLKILDPVKNKSLRFRVSEMGYLQNENKDNIASPRQFCIEYLNSRIVSLVCAMDSDIYSDGELDSYSEESTNNWMDIFNKIALISSIPIICCTLLVYTFIEKLQTLHGRFIMRYVVIVILTTDIIILCIEFNLIKRISVMAYIMQFLYLASFHWITVMCFDIWSTFSNLQIMGENVSDELDTFQIYSMYAWGSSWLISVITFCMQFSPFSELLDVPGFANNNNCLFCGIFHLICYMSMIIHVAVLKVLRAFRNRNGTNSFDAETNDFNNDEWYLCTEV